MILTEQLSKQFDRFLAVDSVSIEVKPGEVLALLGPNGAGKTTTVRMLTSVLKPTSGRAWVAGYDVVEHPDKVRASVGVLTEQHGLYERMRAADYLDFFGQIYSMSRDQRRSQSHYWLDRFGLAGEEKRRIGEFSKGMRQKLALARSLIHNPPVLLLDEPTSAMDPESARLVRDSIHLLRSESRSVLLCTHNLAEAEELADRIAIIRKGKIIQYGPPAEIKRRLMGPVEYEARFSAPLAELPVSLPDGVELTGRGENWLRYRAECPEQVNPAVIAALMEAGLPILSLQEIPRSLEDVYLKVMSEAGEAAGG